MHAVDLAKGVLCAPRVADPLGLHVVVACYYLSFQQTIRKRYHVFSTRWKLRYTNGRCMASHLNEWSNAKTYID